MQCVVVYFIKILSGYRINYIASQSSQSFRTIGLKNYSGIKLTRGKLSRYHLRKARAITR